MTKSEWKKNDLLMKAALKKMGLLFYRDKKTWEAFVFPSRGRKDNIVECFDANDDFIFDPTSPDSLGEISYFVMNCGDRYKTIKNIFFGVKNAEELAIKLDLMLQ